MQLAWIHDPVWLIINTLVAYRLTRLWIDDLLPPLPHVRAWLRSKIHHRWHVKTHHDVKTPDDEWARREGVTVLYANTPPLTSLLDCYWCVGFWISLGTFLAATLTPAAVWPFLAVPLALSAVVGLLGSRD